MNRKKKKVITCHLLLFKFKMLKILKKVTLVSLGNHTGTDSLAEFLQTVAKYRDLQHPGVTPITGVCITVSDDPIVVTPYAQNGDLKSYVRDSNRVS